ncbi:hypothetical protein O0L34_g8155 [Tuta absoluta]|nr:hypothetical protein O0L34_g8155 [Tuta absoluta]
MGPAQAARARYRPGTMPDRPLHRQLIHQQPRPPSPPHFTTHNTRVTAHCNKETHRQRTPIHGNAALHKHFNKLITATCHRSSEIVSNGTSTQNIVVAGKETRRNFNQFRNHVLIKLLEWMTHQGRLQFFEIFFNPFHTAGWLS